MNNSIDLTQGSIPKILVKLSLELTRFRGRYIF